MQQSSGIDTARDLCAAELTARFRSGETRTYQWRMQQVRGIIKMLTECEDELIAAVCKDTGKPVEEMRISEVTQTLCAARLIESDLKGWMADKSFPSWGILFPSTPTLRHEPHGVVLMIAPFNFPLMLVLKPLLGAVAAGNCVLIKPSDACPDTSRILVKLFPKYLDGSAIRIMDGGVELTKSLLAHRWDFICFTGSKRVGKIVAKAAAEHLTPCLLELGGKNVAVVDEHVHSLDVVARRLLWGRFLNAGQSCVAPDVVVCVSSLQAEALKKKMLECYKVFYGTEPKKSPDFGRLISKDAVLRIQTLLQRNDIGEVLIGGDADAEHRYVAPTILSETPASSQLMQDEIFGPVMSVVTVESVDAAIQYVDSITRDPLALYIFSSRKLVVQKILNAIPSGGAVVNDCMVQQGLPHLPFGGRGNSGLGTYHGRFSFDTFSQKRSILYKHGNRNHPLVDFWIRYPPADKTKAFLLTWLARKLPFLPGRVGTVLKLIIAVAPLALWFYSKSRIGI
jgi:acyl-CoA reductase-like NAD-dependent aldehyde dehydrogenase